MYSWGVERDSWGVDGSRPADPLVELAERRRKERMAVEEAGGGQSEGFELSEEELIQHSSHGDEQLPARIIYDAGPDEEEADAVYGEADEEHLADG
jgi:hypothetical protein